MDERRTTGWADGPDAIERPLGRGLEDVSHLFLSQAASPSPTGRSGMGPPSERDGRPRAAGVTPLRPIDALTREQVAAILRDRNVGLEEGLTVIDEGVPCPPAGEIDVLAVDRTSQLVIVDFEVGVADDLLLRGLGHVDWIVRNLPNVRRMYAGRAINFSSVPRLLLLAPRFSETFSRVATSTTHVQVECVRFQAVHLHGGVGVFFERVAAS